VGNRLFVGDRNGTAEDNFSSINIDIIFNI